MARLSELPVFGSEHEEDCIFLGHYEGDGPWSRGFGFDLWYWPGQTPEPTLIARHGRAGSQYSSGLVFGWLEGADDHPLVEARRRAEALGLDVRRAYYEQHPPGRVS